MLFESVINSFLLLRLDLSRPLPPVHHGGGVAVNFRCCLFRIELRKSTPPGHSLMWTVDSLQSGGPLKLQLIYNACFCILLK
jgi:hypothetical protein